MCKKSAGNDPRTFWLSSVAAAAVIAAVVAAAAAAETAHCDYKDKNDYPPAVVISAHNCYLLFQYLRSDVCRLPYTTLYAQTKNVLHPESRICPVHTIIKAILNKRLASVNTFTDYV